MNIGNVIWKLRKGQKMTQADLSLLANITQTYVSQIENGDRIPSQEVIESVCAALKISVGGLYVMALEEKDVLPNKIEVFRTLKPAIDSLFIP